MVVRIHRSLERRAQRVDPDKVANRAEDYIFAHNRYKKFLDEAKGDIVPVTRVKGSVKRIDDLEREILKLEKKIENLEFRRGVEAAKLEKVLDLNLEIAGELLEKDELRDFGV